MKSKYYRVLCDKEKQFLDQGIELEKIYGGIPWRGMSRKDAEEVAKQLRQFKVSGEKYTVVEDKTCL